MYSPEYVGLSPYQITVTCQSGYANSSISNQWEPIWGDGLKIGSEKWDDGNTSSGDGWKGDCMSVESSWVWSGGSPTSRDTWIIWSSGFYQNDATNPIAWVTLWGDGFRAGSEKCDDANISIGDGWNSDCTSVESSYVWSGGSVNSKDTCTFWTTGFYQNNPLNPTLWITNWGDGIKAGIEKCDDQNNVGGDGWSSDCATIETGWVWSVGSLATKDIWIYWTEGLYQNDDVNPTIWVPRWGEGRKAGDEKWDDANTISGDGWSNDWSIIESGWVWSGGSINSKDTWIFWNSGFYQNDPLNPTAWITHWGDGKKVGNEKWDDANTIDGDGWKGDWSSVEQNWVWFGGNSISKDTCTQWSPGLYQNNDLLSTTCVPHWGDGLKAGNEKWDDGNTSDKDGCNSNWSLIEENHVWSGGSTNSKDLCFLWKFGFYQNNEKSAWISKWGDGLKVENEACDDGNTVDGDGCNALCTQFQESFTISQNPHLSAVSTVTIYLSLIA